MIRRMLSLTLATSLFCVWISITASLGQTSAGKVIEISAEDLGKQFAPDTTEAAKLYQGKVLRVTGKVSMANEPFVYLSTGHNFPTGQPVQITLEYSKVTMPKIAVGDRLTVEGKFDRTAIFGPLLVQNRILKREQNGKVMPLEGSTTTSPKTSTKKRGITSKKADQPLVPVVARDSQSILLLFDGQLGEGEPGFRANCTSFRLRFGPGNWTGTKIGKAIAWGDGNKGQDHWGEGSGEPTFSSELRRDERGTYFVFSLNGDDWESDHVAAMFRVTLPDGKLGVATALISVTREP